MALFLAVSESLPGHSIGGVMPVYFRALGIESLFALHVAGYLLIVVWTYDRLPRSTSETMPLEHEIRRVCQRHQLPPARFYNSCDDRIPGSPELPGDNCVATAETFQRAADDLHIDLERSWVMGDRLDTVEAGRRAGCRTILLDNGNESEWRLTSARTPHLIVEDVGIAAHAIVDASRLHR